RLHQHPDGGIARFRYFGTVRPRFPQDKHQILDLASVKNGAVALSCSDQHFGRKENLLLPGRGKDMGDGWETARSRGAGHQDWVIVKLGARASVKKIVIDTAYFRGNFPQRAEVYAAAVEETASIETANWTLLAGGEMKADVEHEFDSAVQNLPFTHAKLVIYPDGGVKRLRVFGERLD
ncbi:MAG: allantoicase, partial [Oxalobacteraceae bacterium]